MRTTWLAMLFVAGVFQLSAGTLKVTLVGANGQTDSSGNLISPYNITMGAAPTVAYCDDFANEDSVGETYTVNVTNLASGNLSNTRYGGISQTLATAHGAQTYDGQQLYEMAAWLTTEFGSNTTTNGEIQDTIWDLFNPNAGDPTVHPPVPGTNTFLFASEANYSSVDAANFNILTNTGPVTLSGPGQTQELIVAPEPSTILLLGLGLMAIGVGGRRAMKRFNASPVSV
jgi:hypothetical protein